MEVRRTITDTIEVNPDENPKPKKDGDGIGALIAVVFILWVICHVWQILLFLGGIALLVFVVVFAWDFGKELFGKQNTPT